MSTPDEANEPRKGSAPQYGEYATPEQQRAAIRRPADAAHAGAPEASLAPLPQTPTQPVRVAPATTTAARPSRVADRILTFALLAYGLVTVISAVPQLWEFAGFAQTWMDFAGVDETFTNTAQGDLWGRIGAGLFVFGWIITAVLSWRSLAAGRLSWWIPAVGAIVTFVIVTVCLTVPLLGDPAIAGHFG